MGNFVGTGTSQPSTEGTETSQPSTGDTKQEEQEPILKAEDSSVNTPDNTKDGPLEEQTTETLMRMASESDDEMELDSTLMSHVAQNQDVLKPQLHTILEELHSKISSSSEEPPRQKKALRCLVVLGATFPRRTFNFLVKKMDEVWKDTVLVFHTINILKAVIHSNGLPAAGESHESLQALSYRQGLLTKLLVIAGVWHTLEIRVAALELLSLVDSMIHENILDLWLERISSLLLYLEKEPENLKQKEWENMLLLFLEDTILLISNELWVNYFVQSLILQLSFCCPREKNFIYKCWGVAMMGSMGTLIETSLWRIIQKINFEETKEREGLANGLGLCAMCHKEDVISILEEYQNYIDQLSTKNYFMEGSKVPITKKQMRTVLFLSYYFVAFLVPADTILPFMSGIFSSMLQNYPHCLKDPLVKLALIDSVILMCQATMEKDAGCSLESRILAMLYLKDILLETPQSCFEIENCQKATKAIICLVSMNMLKLPTVEGSLYDASVMENPQQADKSSTDLAVAAAARKISVIFSDEENIVTSQISGLSHVNRKLVDVPSTPFSSWTYSSLPNDNFEVIDLCISSIMKFPPWDVLENTELFPKSFIPQGSWDSLEMREDTADSSILQTQICYHKTFDVVCEVMRTLIEWHMEPDTLNNIMKAMKSWLVSQQTYERERATRAIAQVLQIYRNQTPPKIQLPIGNVGYMTGQLLPRCVEKHPALHHWGMAAISSLLNVPGQPKTEITAIESIQILGREKKSVPTITIFKTAMLVVNSLPSDELMQFIRSTLEGIVQNESYSEALADILKMVLHHRADELQNRVEILVHVMYDILSSSDTMAVKRAVRSTLGALAYVEPNTMVTTLLTFPWVVLSEIRALWRSLIANKTLFSVVLSILLSMIPEKNQENQETNTTLEKPTYLPNTMAVVLWEFVAAVKRKEQLEEKKEALFYHCFLSIPGASTKQLMDSFGEDYRHSSFLSAPAMCMDNTGGFKSSSFTSLPGTSMQSTMEIIKGCRNCSPCSVAVQALQNILKLGGCEHHILVAMDENNGWELMVNDYEQHKGFAALGRVMRNCCPGAFPRTVVQDFLPSLYFHKEFCWTACVAFFAEFVGSPNIAKEEQKMMLDVYNVMKLFIYNGNPIIIMYGMRGVSNATHTMPKKEKKYKESILGIFLRSLSNPWDSSVKQEAITGILKILAYLPTIETSTSVQLAQQAQNCFDDEDPFIRQKALEIFGQQSQYFHWRRDSFSELTEKHLAHILIHLQDDNPEVARTAEVTLWKCAPFIRHKPLRNLILNFLHKEDHKFTNSFFMEVSRLLVEECPGRLNKTLTTRAAAVCELMGQCLPAVVNPNNRNRNSMHKSLEKSRLLDTVMEVQKSLSLKWPREEMKLDPYQRH